MVTESWVNIDSGNGLLLTVHSNDIHIRAISQEMCQPSITEIHLKMTYLNIHSIFQGANELTLTCTLPTYRQQQPNYQIYHYKFQSLCKHLTSMYFIDPSQIYHRAHVSIVRPPLVVRRWLQRGGGGSVSKILGSPVQYWHPPHEAIRSYLVLTLLPVHGTMLSCFLRTK